MNPFNYDKLAELDAFCGRERELEKLLDITANRNNVLMYGERRYGKSSLILKAFSKMPKTVFTAYVDLYDIVDERDFALKLYRGVVDAMPFSIEEKLKSLAELFNRVRFVATPNRAGDSILFQPEIRDRTFDELIEDVFEAITRLCERKSFTHAVIALDEFQQIGEIKKVKIDAKLRSISQGHAQVCFIFSGSKKNMLRNLVSSTSRPLHGMTTTIAVKGIELPVIRAYCEQRLDGRFENGAFEHLYERVRGQTRLMLQVCFRLYSDNLAVYTAEDVNRVLTGLIEDYDDEYRSLMMGLAGRQRKAIRAIALSGGEAVFSQPILDEINLGAQGLNAALEKLLEHDVVDKVDEGKYVICDVMFHLWASSQLGG